MCSERQINNTAIGSWSGFIYQGLCALYHCLKLIKNNKEQCVTLKLSLDSFEDFAILDNQDNVLSLHQCKNEKNVVSYEEEFEKMRMKRKAFNDDDRCFLYFHTNKIINNFPKDIVAYPFTDQKKYCTPVELVELIEIIVKELTCDEDLMWKKKVSALFKMIDKKVLQIHEIYLKSKEKQSLRSIAKREFILFSEIIDVLNNEENFSEDNFNSYVKCKMITYLMDYRDDEDNLCDARLIDDFIDKVNKLPNTKLTDFIKRLNPNYNCNSRDIDLLSNIANERANSCLCMVLSGTSELNENLDWTDKSKRQTPTTLGKDIGIGKICRCIYENSANIDILYEYDWLVGNVERKIDSIVNEPRCTKIKDDNPKNIFNKKKIGILRIEDKKNGDY
jgi:predicted DNA-binding ribbon-helix-helix protein